jgi:hypothetical protein
MVHRSGIPARNPMIIRMMPSAITPITPPGQSVDPSVGCSRRERPAPDAAVSMAQVEIQRLEISGPRLGPSGHAGSAVSSA